MDGGDMKMSVNKTSENNQCDFFTYSDLIKTYSINSQRFGSKDRFQCKIHVLTLVMRNLHSLVCPLDCYRVAMKSDLTCLS
jgi:hypothetical protein